MDETMSLLIEKLPRWRTYKDELVGPNDVLRVAADILEAVSAGLRETPARADARRVLDQSITLLRAVSETSVGTPVSRVPQA